jgi:hypothetical protein
LSERSCSVSAACVPTRLRSTSCSFVSTCISDVLSGCTRSSIAFWRPSRSSRAACWNSVSDVLASSRNDWLFWRSASDESAENASRSFDLGVVQQRQLLGGGAPLGLELRRRAGRLLPRR